MTIEALQDDAFVEVLVVVHIEELDISVDET